ncbi:unnamed protein product [Chrysodeixis includens]|uniref:Uncharacterized protein n=1 Tax=Chrysodeixis includens TaxID=689277 RepID=A0A9N8KZ81_CHRIL|nr:unnamed protein product [Chrysodeixis includens]
MLLNQNSVYSLIRNKSETKTKYFVISINGGESVQKAADQANLCMNQASPLITEGVDQSSCIALVPEPPDVPSAPIPNGHLLVLLERKFNNAQVQTRNHYQDVRNPEHRNSTL